MGWPPWSSTAAPTDARPERDAIRPPRRSRATHRGERPKQRRERPRAGAVALHERRPRREHRAHLLRRQRGEHREPARGELRRETDADVGDQAGPAGRPLLDDVEDLATVQDGEVAAVGRAVDQARQHRPRDPLQRRLPRVRRAELEGRDPEAVAALAREVHDEPLRAQHREQVVDGGAREPQIARDRARRHRRGVAGEELEDGQRVRCRGGVRHGRRIVSDPRQNAFATPLPRVV